MALLIWAAVAASAVAWGARWLRATDPLPAHTQVATDRALPRGDWTRPLGSGAAAMAGAPGAQAGATAGAERRLSLVGVIASPREGVALIAVDGLPARAYRMGAVVDGQWTVRRIDQRGVTLAAADAATHAREGPALTRLELPPLPSAQK